MSTTLIMYLLTMSLLFVSFYKDKENTKKAFQVAKKSAFKTLPSLVTLIGLAGLTLGLLSPTTISKLVGAEAGFTGTFLSAIVGSITLIPALVAFPLAGSLLRSGATVMTVSAFITTLVMVGAMTAPLEIKTFGKKFTLLRNVSSFIIALLIAFVMGGIIQ